MMANVTGNIVAREMSMISGYMTTKLLLYLYGPAFACSRLILRKTVSNKV